MSWPTVRLGSVCEVFSGFPFKSDGFTEDPDDIPLVKGENIGQGEILWGISRRWPRAEVQELDRYRLAPDDVVLAMDRPWVPAGLKFARMREGDPEALLVQRVARLRARSGLAQRFLSCLVASPGFVDYIRNIARGVGVPHISGAQIGDFECRLPPMEVQARLAQVLLAYDDLIENNRRRMALLEEAARQLYREWFVRLRFPGHEHARMVDGVPVGWTATVLGQVAENLDRQRVPLSVFEREARPGPHPYHGAAGVLDHIDGYLFDGRYLLVGEDGTVQTTAGTPMLQLVEGKFWVSNHAHVLKGAAVSTEFLFCCLSAYPIAGHVTGVAQPKLTQANLNRIPVTTPATVYRQQFQEVVEPMFDQLFVLRAQNERLRAARDLLLPRLMSGEIAV